MQNIQTFKLSTTDLAFYQLQEYMNQMKSEWNWTECKVIAKDNDIIFELYADED